MLGRLSSVEIQASLGEPKPEPYPGLRCVLGALGKNGNRDRPRHPPLRVRGGARASRATGVRAPLAGKRQPLPRALPSYGVPLERQARRRRDSHRPHARTPLAKDSSPSCLVLDARCHPPSDTHGASLVPPLDCAPSRGLSPSGVALPRSERGPELSRLLPRDRGRALAGGSLDQAPRVRTLLPPRWASPAKVGAPWIPKGSGRS